MKESRHTDVALSEGSAGSGSLSQTTWIIYQNANSTWIFVHNCPTLHHVLSVHGTTRSRSEPATTEDIIEMHRLTEEARAGVDWGSRFQDINHRSSKGEPAWPTSEHDELVGMANALHTIGYGVMEMISDFEDLDTEFELLKSMVSSADRPASISLAQGISVHGWQDIGQN